MKPSIGRIVHYRESNELIYAALVVAVNEDGTVNLAVWDTEGDQECRLEVTQGSQVDQWDWPPRV